MNFTYYFFKSWIDLQVLIALESRIELIKISNWITNKTQVNWKPGWIHSFKNWSQSHVTQMVNVSFQTLDSQQLLFMFLWRIFDTDEAAVDVESDPSDIIRKTKAKSNISLLIHLFWLWFEIVPRWTVHLYETHLSHQKGIRHCHSNQQHHQTEWCVFSRLQWFLPHTNQQMLLF
jgi:hypothetical protein